MKGFPVIILLIVLIVIGALAINSGYIKIPMTTINPTNGHQYAILDLFGYIQCQRLGPDEYSLPMASSSSGLFGWLIGKTVLTETARCGDHIFGPNCNIKITLHDADLAYGVATQLCKKSGSGIVCGDIIPLLVQPFNVVGAFSKQEFNLPQIGYSDYYNIIHYGIKSGYVTWSGDKYGLRGYVLTNPNQGIIVNAQNCNLEGLNINEMAKICAHDICDFPRNTLTWEASNDIVSVFAGSTIGLSELNFVHDSVTNKQVYCEVGAWSGTQVSAILHPVKTYTASNGVIYDYADTQVDNVVRVISGGCCPNVNVPNCGDDFQYHYNQQTGQPITQPITCVLVSICTGGGSWVQDPSNPNQNIHAIGCINNKCQYEYKGNLWSVKKTYETMVVDTVTGSSSLTVQVGGQENSTLGGGIGNITEQEEYMKSPPAGDDTMMWLILIVVVIIIVMMLTSKGGGVTVVTTGGK
jgi:hypothetical protein